MSLLTDQQIIDRVLGGDKDAFTTLVERYQQKVFGMAIGMLKNREEAEEVAQDIFIKIYTSLSKFRGDASFATWAYRISYNKCLDKIKGLKRRQSQEFIEDIYEGELDLVDNGLDYLDAEERKQMVGDALNKLDAEHRIVLTLFYFDELSLKEISKVVGISENNTKVRLYRSRKKLFGILKQAMNTQNY